MRYINCLNKKIFIIKNPKAVFIDLFFVNLNNPKSYKFFGLLIIANKNFKYYNKLIIEDNRILYNTIMDKKQLAIEFKIKK